MRWVHPACEILPDSSQNSPSKSQNSDSVIKESDTEQATASFASEVTG